MKKILLTEAQYDLLKTVLDDACERGIHADRQVMVALWRSCADATTEPAVTYEGGGIGCAPQVL